MGCSTSRRQHQLPVITVRVGSDFVTPSTSIRGLGIFLDSDASTRTHVRWTVSSCVSALRQLRSVRRSVPVDTFQLLVISLVLSRLDYGNATLVDLPTKFLQQLQSVLNASARFVFAARKYDYGRTLRNILHWLHFSERITYKVGVLTLQCLHGTAPEYLSADLHHVADVPSRSLAVVCGLRPPLNCWCLKFVCRQWTIVRFLRPPLEFETVCLLTSPAQRRYYF
jgi:hypothetical protein